MAEVTPQQLDQIEARANAATVGPWEYKNHTAERDFYGWRMDHGWQTPVSGRYGFEEGDARFIAAARTDVPQLVAEVRRLWSVSAEEVVAIEDIRIGHMVIFDGTLTVVRRVTHRDGAPHPTVELHLEQSDGSVAILPFYPYGTWFRGKRQRRADVR